MQPRKGSDCTGTAASALSCIASELQSNRVPATAELEWYLLLENPWSGAAERAEVVGEKGRDVLLVPLTCTWNRARWHTSPARLVQKSIQSLLPSAESSTQGKALQTWKMIAKGV